MRSSLRNVYCVLLSCKLLLRSNESTENTCTGDLSVATNNYQQAGRRRKHRSAGYHGRRSSIPRIASNPSVNSRIAYRAALFLFLRATTSSPCFLARCCKCVDEGSRGENDHQKTDEPTFHPYRGARVARRDSRKSGLSSFSDSREIST